MILLLLSWTICRWTLPRRHGKSLAERLVPYFRAVREANPGLDESRADARRGKRFADKVIDDAMSELYNSAQLDVLRRAGQILRGG